MLKKSIVVLLLLTVMISMVACVANRDSNVDKSYTDPIYPDEYESPTPPAPPETTDATASSNNQINN